MNLLKASFWLTSSQTVATIVLALNYFLLAANLSPEDLGIASILMMLQVLALSLVNLGYHKAAIYYIGRKIYSLETIIANSLLLCFLQEILLLVFLFVAHPVLSSWFPNIPWNVLFLAIACTPLQVLVYYLSEASVAAELIRINISIRTLSVGIYVSGCLFSILTGKLSPERVIIFWIVGFAVADLVAIGQVIAYSKDRKQFAPNLQAALECLKFGIKSQVGELAHYLSLRIDVLLVGLWAGVAASGFYSMATRLIEITWYASIQAQVAFSAKFAQSSQGENKQSTQRLQLIVKYMFLLSGILALGMLGISAVLFKLFLPAYLPALSFLLILTPGGVAMALFYSIIGCLVGDGRPVIATRLRLILLAFSVLLYLLLIPQWGAWGASVATSVAYLVAIVITVIESARLYKFPLKNYFLWQRADIITLKMSALQIFKVISKNA